MNSESIGKKYKFLIIIESRKLFFTGVIKDISLTHFTFIDKENKTLSFRLTDLVEAEEVKE